MSAKTLLKEKIGSSWPVKRLGSWWDTISHHPFWATLIAGLIVAVVARLLLSSGAPQHASASSSASRTPPLRVAAQQLPQEIFAIALAHNIGTPAASETWVALHARGGVSVVKSAFELTLADRSTVPLTVTNVEAVVVRSEPAPKAWEGLEFTQGGEGIEQFRAFLTSGASGSAVPVSQGDTEEGEGLNGPPYFRTHDVSLTPGQIYQAAVTIVNTVEDRELQYRFVVSGNTASGPFTVETRSFRITGWRGHYAHRYWHVTEGSRQCWMRMLPPGMPHCP
jgi:hypothetical protein